jgi:HEAT repeat protein
LTELLGSADPEVRCCAAAALGRIGKAAAPAVPALLRLLHDPDDKVLCTAVHALPSIGEAARPAIPRLIELLSYRRSAFYHIPTQAAHALVVIGRDDPTAVAALVARLDKDPGDLQDAVYPITEVGPAAKAAVPRLIALYRSKPRMHPGQHRLLREEILHALAAIGPAAKTARPVIDEALGDPDKDVRYAAALALGMLGPSGKGAVPVLLDAMRDDEVPWWWPNYWDRALKALGSVGPAAAAAIPALTEMLRTERDAERRRALRQALARIRGRG